MAEKSVVIFDLDGVLFDSIDLMFSLMSADYSDLTREEFSEAFKANIYSSLEKLAPRMRPESAEEKERRRLSYTERKLAVPMYPGMRDLVLRLSEAHDLVLNTSALARNSIPLLEKQGIADRFSFVASRELDPSKTAKLKLIAQRFSKEPREMTFVTDTVGDVLEAEEAGVPTIAVTWGLHTETDFSAERRSNLVGMARDAHELEELLSKRALVKS